MTYGEANRKFRVFGISFLAVAFAWCMVFGCIVGNVVSGRDVPNGAWLILALATVGAVLLLWQMVEWQAERASIRVAWQRRINNIDTFLFLAHGPLQAEGIRVIRHLWKSDSAQSALMFWSEEKLREAASTYPCGSEQFLFQLLHLQFKGFLEFSPENYHRLSIGENLWDVVRDACCLDGFSANSNDDQSVEEARQKLKKFCES